MAAPNYTGTGNGTIVDIMGTGSTIAETWTVNVSNATKVGVANYGTTVSGDSPVMHWRLNEGSTSGSATYDTTVNGDIPVMYWRLAETSGTNANDETANNIHGTISGTPVLGGTTLLAKDTDKSITLDGVDDKVISAANAIIQITGDMTFECVVNQSDNSGTQTLGIIGVTGTTSADNTLFHVQLINGDISLSHEYSTNTLEIDATGVSLVQGVTYHLAVTRNVTSNDYIIYLNGISVYTWNYTNDPTGGGNTFFSLGLNPGTSEYFDGVVDELALYAAILTPAEVTTHSEDAIGIAANVTVLDETINNIDGTSQFTTDDVGLLSVDTDNAFSFNGVNSNIRGPIDIDAQLADVDATLECVLKPTTVSGTQFICGVGAAGILEADNYLISMWLIEGYIKIYHEYGIGQIEEQLTGAFLTAGETHHIAVTRDASTKNYVLYVGGIEEANYIYSFAPSGGTNSIVLAGLDADSGSAFTGVLDEIALYGSVLTIGTLRSHAEDALGHETFTVTGSTTGALANGIIGLPYTSAHLTFKTTDGTTDFIVSDNWTIASTAGALGSQAWIVKRWEANTTVFLEGPGLSATDNIFINIEAYKDPGNNLYNWKIRGADGYSDLFGIDNQLNASPDGTYLGLWDDVIPYWFYASGRRFIVVAKVTTIYHSCYAGFYLPFATPTEYPYPIMIAASLGNVTDTYTETGTYDDDSPISMSIGCIVRPALRGMFFRDLNGGWEPVMCNYQDTLITSHSNAIVHPYAEGTQQPTKGGLGFLLVTKLRDGLGGDYALTPCTIIRTGYNYNKNSLQHDDSELLSVWGEFDGPVHISGFGNAVENTVTVGGDTYDVFQNAFRTGTEDYYAIKQE